MLKPLLELSLQSMGQKPNVHHRWAMKCDTAIHSNETGKKKKVPLIWVRGHSGNKKANILARKGARTRLTDQKTFCGIGKNL